MIPTCIDNQTSKRYFQRMADLSADKTANVEQSLMSIMSDWLSELGMNQTAFANVICELLILCHLGCMFDGQKETDHSLKSMTKYVRTCESAFGFVCIIYKQRGAPYGPLSQCFKSTYDNGSDIYTILAFVEKRIVYRQLNDYCRNLMTMITRVLSS